MERAQSAGVVAVVHAGLVAAQRVDLRFRIRIKPVSAHGRRILNGPPGKALESAF